MQSIHRRKASGIKCHTVEETILSETIKQNNAIDERIDWFVLGSSEIENEAHAIAQDRRRTAGCSVWKDSIEVARLHECMIEVIIANKDTDVALTIGVHPTNLGIRTQDAATIWVPSRLKLTCRRVTDMFKYNERSRAAGAPGSSSWMQVDHMHPGQNSIPEHVMSIEIREQAGFNLDAVVVVEHRNIASILTEDDHGLKKVLIIMVRLFWYWMVVQRVG